MKNKLMQILFVVLVLLTCQTQFVKAFEESDFAYFKEIQVDENQETGVVAVEFDVDIFQKSKYTDLRLIDNEGAEQAFNLIQQDFTLLSPSVMVVDASEAENEDNSPERMLDGDFTTYYQAIEGEFDPIWEASKSFITIDLGVEKKVEIIDFSLAQSAKNWSHLAVYASADNVNFTPTQAKIDNFVPNVLHFENLSTRYLKFEFGYQKLLAIAEISVYGAGNSKIILNYDSSKKYRLFYGNLKDVDASSLNSELIYSKDLPVLVLGEEQANPNYNSDFDEDGVINSEDNCPFDSNETQGDSDQDGEGDICDANKEMDNRNQIDVDYDGVGQSSDNCLYIRNAKQIDKNQNGIGDLCEDSDHDTIINYFDNCVDVANYKQIDVNEDGRGDVCEGDYDGDGVEQIVDNCKSIANPEQIDTDEDGLGDKCDNCLQKKNPNQVDKNQNGVGDLCEDSDSDGVLDMEDNCKEIANPDQADEDEDSRGNVCDNCPKIKNASQWDDDNDGIGNDCDDDDADGLIGKDDNCPNHSNADQADSDGNGIGDVCEDFDNDTVVNISDNCPKQANQDQLDSDGDGFGDVCDTSTSLIVKKRGTWFYVVLGVIAFAFLYYSLTLARQIKASKEEEKK